MIAIVTSRLTLCRQEAFIDHPVCKIPQCSQKECGVLWLPAWHNLGNVKLSTTCRCGVQAQYRVQNKGRPTRGFVSWVRIAKPSEDLRAPLAERLFCLGRLYRHCQRSCTRIASQVEPPRFMLCAFSSSVDHLRDMAGAVHANNRQGCKDDWCSRRFFFIASAWRSCVLN